MSRSGSTSTFICFVSPIFNVNWPGNITFGITSMINDSDALLYGFTMVTKV